MLGQAIDRLTRDQTRINLKDHNTRLVGLERPKIRSELFSSRCKTVDEMKNFSQLRSDDLVFLIILFQHLEKNLHEYDHLLHDIRRIAESLNRSSANHMNVLSPNHQQLYVQKRRFEKMIKTLSKRRFVSLTIDHRTFVCADKIFRQMTNEGDFFAAFGEFLSSMSEKSPHQHDDLQAMLQTIGEKTDELREELRRNSTNSEENQRHILLIDRFKEKYFPDKE